MRSHSRASKMVLSCAAAVWCAFLAATPSAAQGLQCENESWASKEMPVEYAGKPNISSAVMRLKIYVVRDDNGQGGATAAELDSLIAHTRADYSAHNIFFDVSWDTVKCSECLTDTSTISAFDLMDDDDSTLSAAVFPAPAAWDFSKGGSQGVPANKVWVGIKPGSFDGAVLSHEIGHNFGLYHTFERYCTLPDDSSNCDECGDLVCDTIYDTFGDSLRAHVDRESCEFDPGTMQPPTPTGDPLNIMAYSWPWCMTEFTDGQVERMFYFIETHSLVRYAASVPAVTYENRSSDTELNYDGTPYSSTILDYNDDGKKDLFVSMRDDHGSLQKQTQLAYSQVPQFTDRTTNDFAAGDEPQEGLRGVVAADYDNDGRADLFVAAEAQPRLYHNNSDSLSASFADSAAALGVAALADSSYAGAWGDFDRDGQIDLYVCRGTGGGDDPTAANLDAVHGRLLRNDLRASHSFSDSSNKLGAAADALGASVAASWADFDDDGDLDLYVGDLRDAVGTASSRLYVNDGAGNLTESFADRFSGETVENVNSVVWGDLNNDGKLDLVLGSETSTPTVYFNNGYGEFDTMDPLSADLDAATNGVRPVDADLDGLVDLVAVPRETSDHRWLFWNQVIGGEQALLDQSYRAGFADSTGRVDGLAMADFNGDGDTDVYFGRPVDTNDIFYRAKAANCDTLDADWVGVQLVAGGGNNGSAIGASVRFYIGTGTPDYQQVQIVDGGSGKGGQADNVLICGLGDRNGTVSAEIRWPGGYVQTATLDRGEVTSIVDATAPGEPDSVSGVYTALPEGEAEFTFTWDTAFSCDPSLDKVTISDRPRQPSQCPMGTVVLTPSTENVTHAVIAKSAQNGGGYRHTLTWHLECRAPCSYNFLIESATDNNHKSSMQNSQQVSMPVCISE